VAGGLWLEESTSLTFSAIYSRKRPLLQQRPIGHVPLANFANGAKTVRWEGVGQVGRDVKGPLKEKIFARFFARFATLGRERGAPSARAP
jgi:hypothetical protein